MIPHLEKSAAFALAGAMALGTQTTAAQNIADDLHRLMSTTDYREVVIAPDHRHLAWVQAVPGTGSDLTIGTSIRIGATGGREPPVIVTAPSHAPQAKTPPDEDSPAWSPDGSTLAFLSDAESPGQKQLYLYDMAHGKARRLTAAQGYLATPLWSRDGRSLAVLFTEGSSRIAGPLSAGAPATGVIDAHVFEQRIALVNLDSGALRPVSPADLYVYE